MGCLSLEGRDYNKINSYKICILKSGWKNKLTKQTESQNNILFHILNKLSKGTNIYMHISVIFVIYNICTIYIYTIPINILAILVAYKRNCAVYFINQVKQMFKTQHPS